MIFILLPAYNEEDSFPELLDEITGVLDKAGEPFQFVVCDDGSTDGTSMALKVAVHSYPVHVITHTRNRGLGETIRDLMEHAADHSDPDDILIRMDCDLTHGADVIPSLIAAVRNGADVALASRFQEGGGQIGVEGMRKWLSTGANLFMRLFFPIKGVKEYSCGYRGYRAGIIKQALVVYGSEFIQLRSLGFSVTLEKLVKLNLLGARFAEVPFVLRYDRKKSDSKMIANLTTLGYLVLVLLYHWPFGGWRSIIRKRKDVK